MKANSIDLIPGSLPPDTPSENSEFHESAG